MGGDAGPSGGNAEDALRGWKPLNPPVHVMTTEMCSIFVLFTHTHFR